MNITQELTNKVYLSESGLTFGITKTTDINKREATFQFFYEWPNGDRGTDLSELTLSLEELQGITVLFNAVSDWRVN